MATRAYRKYLRVARGEHFTIDEEKIKQEARYDGQWVLQTKAFMAAGVALPPTLREKA